jgi:hypothetical protein
MAKSMSSQRTKPRTTRSSVASRSLMYRKDRATLCVWVVVISNEYAQKPDGPGPQKPPSDVRPSFVFLGGETFGASSYGPRVPQMSHPGGLKRSRRCRWPLGGRGTSSSVTCSRTIFKCVFDTTQIHICRTPPKPRRTRAELLGPVRGESVTCVRHLGDG